MESRSLRGLGIAALGAAMIIGLAPAACMNDDMDAGSQAISAALQTPLLLQSC